MALPKEGPICVRCCCTATPGLPMRQVLLPRCRIRRAYIGFQMLVLEDVHFVALPLLGKVAAGMGDIFYPGAILAPAYRGYYLLLLLVYTTLSAESSLELTDKFKQAIAADPTVILSKHRSLKEAQRFT